MSPARFLEALVVDILKIGLSEKKTERHDGSRGTLWQCFNRNTVIGNKVIDILTSLITSEIRFDKLKKKKIFNFLEQFLTEEEKNYIKNNPDNIKDLVRFASRKINSKGKGLMKQNKKDNFRIVDMDELINMGWSIKDMLNANIGLDFETIEYEKEEHNGSFEQWFEIYKKNADCIRWLLDSDDNVIGYWHFEPLFDEMFSKAKKGELLETEVTFSKIPQMLANTYNIYFIGICLKEEHRRKRKTFGKLLYSIVDVFENLAKDNIFINEICALAYTDSGVRLCESIGLKYTTDHIEHGKIYSGKTIDLINKDFCQGYVDLIERYKNKLKSNGKK